MNTSLAFLLPLIFFWACTATSTTQVPGEGSESLVRNTEVSIQGNQFLINGELTYKGKTWEGNPIEGLLFNSRMVQGIFDDLNPETRPVFAYPDTGEWDPDRNTDEFVAAMEDWYNHGLLAFTLNLQGGSPTGYGNKNWYNSAFDATGNIRPAYLDRLERILVRADELGMVVILGYFYFGQDQNLKDEMAIKKAVSNITQWLLDQNFRNILIEINNECDVSKYDHEILKPARVHELIEQVRGMEKNGRRLWVGTSYGGRSVPQPNVTGVSDFLLIHGNGVKDPAYIMVQVDSTRNVAGYRGQPILYNEDDHYDFDQAENNFANAIRTYTSWGYFDFRRPDETDISIGFQSVPVDWRINSPRKKAFFNKLKEVTGK